MSNLYRGLKAFVLPKFVIVFTNEAFESNTRLNISEVALR